MDFAVAADHRVKLKESEKRGKYLDLLREIKKKTKKTMEHEGNRDISFNYCTRNNPQGVFSWCNGQSDQLGNRIKRVRTPVALLHSLSIKYP